MSCWDSFTAYGLRSIGIGERLLPKSDITLCDQFALIGSGLIWNVYFTVLSLLIGFCFATVLALGKARGGGVIRKFCAGFIFVFRGSPLFIQIFFAYELFVLLPKVGFEFSIGPLTLSANTAWMTRAWLGVLIVLICNTAAYTAEIFYGALRAVPKGDLEAADAIGLSGFRKFRCVTWPTMLRLAWPSYTNEAIFLFHSTTLVFLAAFPAWRQKGEALYYARYFAEKTFNPFVAYPIVAGYFIVLTIIIILLFGRIGARLNRHLAPERRERFKFRPQYIR